MVSLRGIGQRNGSMTRKATIYLADLTHRGLVLSSNVFPLAIVLVGGDLLREPPGKAEVELFKYPEAFAAALDRRPPDIVGFANYSWNFHLEYEFARVIKELWPRTVIVFGGPNYGLEREETDDFWRRYGLIDFY